MLARLVAEVVRSSTSSPARTLLLAQEALSHASLSPRLRVDVLKAIALAHHHQGDVVGAIEHMQRALQAATELGDVDRTARCLNNMGILEWSRGRLEPALQAQRQALTLAGRASPLAAICLTNIGLIAESLGELALALQFTKVAHALLPAGSERAGAALNCGTLSQRLGQHVPARGFLQEAVELAERAGATTVEINARSALAWADAQIGQRTTARLKLLLLARRAGEAGLQVSRWRAQILIGETLMWDGQAADAARMGLECAAALEALHQDRVATDSLGQWLPQALAACGRWREAYEWLLRSTTRPLAGNAGELEVVRQSLVALAAEPWALPVTAALTPNYRAVPEVATRLQLSELDARILCAVVGGQRNADIAASMGLSSHTVRNRLSAAMRRLGVGSRTAAARRALELGIVTLDAPPQTGP